MPLPNQNNQIITLDEASKLTKRYREKIKQGEALGGLFWKNGLEKLLSQSNCVAMRYYYGINDDGKPVIILVGVNDSGDDIIDGVLLEIGPLCPPFCPSMNKLNS